MKSNKSVQAEVLCIQCSKMIVSGNFSSLYVIGEIMDHRCEVTKRDDGPDDTKWLSEEHKAAYLDDLGPGVCNTM